MLNTNDTSNKKTLVNMISDKPILNLQVSSSLLLVISMPLSTQQYRGEITSF